MAEGSNGRRRFSDKWGKHELDVLAVLSSAFPQWLTSRQIAQRVKAYADSYGELADQAAKAAFAKQFQRDRAKLAAMGIAIESRQPDYSSKSEGQDFASYRLQLGDEPRVLGFDAAGIVRQVGADVTLFSPGDGKSGLTAVTRAPDGEIRLSFSIPVLAAAHARMFLVLGPSKAAALKAVWCDEQHPAALLADADWFVDVAAAHRLEG